MTSNGPYGPDPSTGRPGEGPFEPTPPTSGEVPPAHWQPPHQAPPTQQPNYTQPAPGSFDPPPSGHPEAATQAVPNYATPSTADYQAQPFNQPADRATDPAGRPGGQRALLAGVLGGLVTLGAIAGAFLIFNSDDDPGEPDPEPPVGTVAPETDDPAGSTILDADDRVGTSVAALELLPGDCINYDTTATNIETFDVVTCGTPHIAEIAAQLPYPAAGDAYPGVTELHNWAATPCRDATSDYLGAELSLTTFTSTTLVPELDEWNDGLTSVGCIVQTVGGGRLVESVEGRGSSYERDPDEVISRLLVGDCFLPRAPQTAFQLEPDDIVLLAPCDEAHDGLYFGRGELVAAPGEAYPGEEVVDEESIEICDAAFVASFGVPSDGLNYRYWTPDQIEWDDGDRGVHCAVLDENGLPTSLDYGAFEPMYLLPVGQCFAFGPEESVDALGLDDKVQPIDCSQPHHGEVFGLGELPATSDPFPGDEAADQEIQQICIDLFTTYVGISPFDSTSGDFRYWFPSQAGWEANDLRWACALVTDDPLTGSIEGTNT